MLAALLAVTACCLFAYTVVVVRADPRRWDNRVFAALAFVDGATAALRALVVLEGYRLSDLTGIRASALEALIGYVTVEFAWSFPFSKPAPMWVRAIALPSALAAAAFIFFDPAGCSPWVSIGFFLPVSVVTVVLTVRNYRRVTGAQSAAVRAIMFALGLRWVSGQLTYLVARALGPNVFHVALTVDSTAMVLASMVLVGYAVCAGQLFRVRGFVAEIFLYIAFFVTVAAATFADIEAALAYAPGPTSLRLALFCAALMPLALTGLARRWRGRVERVVLGVDPRRAARAAVLERALRELDLAVAPATLAIVRAALAEITRGGSARFLAAPGERTAGADGELDPARAAELAATESGYVVRGAELVVAAHTGRRLHGALVVTGGQLDRDSLVTAAALAHHLAVKLDNESLVVELEESRRLATLGSFAAAIAHDIRTPLTSVQMNIQILRGKSHLPADDMEHFDIALEELKRLNLHVSDLLDYAKPVRLAAVRLEPRELADDAARAVAPLCDERAVTLTVVDGGGGGPVMGDANRMHQVLVNLLDNAARASGRGAEVTLRTARADDGRVALEVADRGKGIEPADLPRIFEPFFTTRSDGTGLGLAIVHKLVRAHDGEILVRSTPGQGSTFTVLLPAAP